jgi:hypothetical protein
MSQSSHHLIAEIELLGRDEDSLNYLEWKVDTFYKSQQDFDKEVLGDRPDLIEIEECSRKVELFCMLDYFEEKEEYEKCARIKKILDSID